MNIPGLNAYHGDSAVVLIVDGIVVKAMVTIKKYDMKRRAKIK